MSPALRESLRHAILRIAESNMSRWGLTAEGYACFLIRFGLEASCEEIGREAQYLEDKGFLARVPKPISPEIPAWRITAAGRDFVAAHE